MSDLFYLQDSRSFVGNDMLWWAKDAKGYTTDLSKAHVYTREQAMKQHHSRESDIPWPKDYIDGITRPVVDMQYASKAAIKEAGVELIKPERPKRETIQCHSCGRFVNETEYLCGCRNCGASR